MLPSQILALHRSRVLALAAARGASAQRVFGSVAKGIDTETSDIEMLVEVPLGTSLLDIVGLQLDLESVLRVKIDLCTEPELHLELNERILAEARAL